ncbi:beta-phosphoglucomutase family hydrolase [Vibrio olivae]|uniref:Beta-phosphoglucomutase family hydrolase n=1 Tax=Vibrio olivae TaxID=1243002 RepID=A0ABV5HRQ3_9VIBR
MLINYDNYDGLIFDMDGTLIDTMPAHLTSWQKASQAFDFPYDQTWLHSRGGMPSKKIVDEINQIHHLSLDAQAVADFKMKTFASLEDTGERINVTNEVLERYVGKKPIAVGTGSQKVSALPLLKTHGILKKLDAVVTANDVENHKPNPDTFLLAAEQIHLSPERCLVFEDTKLGLQAAHAAGMDCVLVENNQLVFYPLDAKA